MRLSIKEIINATGARTICEGTAQEIAGVSTDTRTIKSGELFIAIKGPHFDGRKFIDDAIGKGAIGAVIDAKDEAERGKQKGWILHVKDSVHALGDIAACWRRHVPITCVAVTGSNGKSTTKEMIAAALAETRKVLKTEGNFNNLIGLPLQIMRMTPEYDVGVFEMGMNAKGEIKRLTSITDPDVGLITNVNPAHLEKLHTIENVAQAKGELFGSMRHNGTIVINMEDPWIARLGNEYPGKKITFGIQNGCDVQFGRMSAEELSNVDLTFYVKGREYAMHLPLPGAHNVMNALAAVAVGVALDIPVVTMITGIEAVKPMKMRMERVQLANGVQLINDTYNANPASMCAALKTVSAVKRAGRFIAVFGDMLELGEAAAEKHRELGENAALMGVAKLFAVGSFASEVAAGAKAKGLDGVVLSGDVEAAAKLVRSEVRTGDVVLVKGSRGMRMERVAEFLKDNIGV